MYEGPGSEQVELPVDPTPAVEAAPGDSPATEPVTPQVRARFSGAAGLFERIEPRYRMPFALGAVGLVVVLVVAIGFSLSSASGTGPSASAIAAIPSMSLSPASATPTVEPTATATATAAASPTPTASPTPAATPTPTSTSTPAPIESDAPTPEATLEPDPDATPVAGYGKLTVGTVAIFGGVVKTGTSRYLAYCAPSDVDEPAICSSHDLTTWVSPVPASDLQVSGTGFGLGDPIKVKSGYAMAVENDAGDKLNWYAADGVHWKVGIPDDLRPPVLNDPCAVHAVSDCEELESITSAPGGLAIATYWSPADANNYVWSRMVYSQNGGTSWAKASLPAASWQMISPPVVDASGRWAAIFSINPGPPPPGTIRGDEAPTQLLISSDGIHWTASGPDDPQWVTADGDTMYVTTMQAMERSTDGGRTWQQVETRSGSPVLGDWVQAIDGRILVYVGGTPDDPTILDWVGP